MNTKTKKYIILLGIIVIVIVGIVYYTRGRNSDENMAIATGGLNAQASTQVELELEFPIKNDKGEDINKFKYKVETAELRNEIIVKGQRATSLNDRTFLVLNIKLSNPLDQAIQINTRDYIRLVRNGNTTEQLAPDIHNDPVQVQAISTKVTRVAFQINKNDNDLQLQVGEIKGEKQIVPIAF